MSLQSCGIDVPNLDDMSVDPADYVEAAAVFETLAKFSRVKAVAMKARLDGNMNLAEEKDEELHRIWKTLPKWARW